MLGDLPGPKLRIGELRGDVAELETGMHVTLTPRDGRGRRGDDPGHLARRQPRCTRTSSSTSPTARSGCGCASREDGGVDCEVEVGGTLSSHKGMNIPGADTGLPAVDRARPRAGSSSRSSKGVDLLAVSFVSPRRRPRAGGRSGCARSAPTSR